MTASLKVGGTGATTALGVKQNLALDQVSNTSDLTKSRDPLNPVLALITRINLLLRYGFIGDGLSHPISSITYFSGTDTTNYTLAQWQSLVPQITALTNEIDGVALQATINAQGSNIYHTFIRLPANTQALISFPLKSVGHLYINGFGARLIAKFLGSPIIIHGTQAAPLNGEFHLRNIEIDCQNTACGISTFTGPSVGAGSGKAVEIIDCTVYNVSGGHGIEVINAARTVHISNVTIWASSYKAGFNGLQITARQYDANTVGNSSASAGVVTSSNLYNIQTSNFEDGIRFSMLNTGASSSGMGTAYGHIEGVIVDSCRFYNGKNGINVINQNNLAGSYQNYGAPLWRITNSDYQGFGSFARLSGLTDVTIQGCWFALDQSNSNAPTSGNTQILYWEMCNNVVVQNNTFCIFSFDTKTPIQCVFVNGYNVGPALIIDNALQADIVFDAFCQFDNPTNTSGQFVITERNTILTRSNLPTIWCRDGGTCQNSEGRVKAFTNASMLNDGQILYQTSLSCTVQSNGNVTIPLPSGLYRQTPILISAQTANYGQFPYRVEGTRNDFGNTSQGIAVMQSGAPTGTNALVLNVSFKGR